MKLMTNLLVFLLLAMVGCNAAVHENVAPEVHVSNIDTSSKPLLKPTGYVNDFYSLFTVNERYSLDSLISAYEKRTTVEIAIVTLDSSYTSKENFDAYTLQLAKHWGVGKRETNNGILIGLCPDYRRIRIQNGYGIESRLTDAATKRILDEIVLPQFKQNQYYEGLYEGILAITQKLDEAK